MRNHARLQRGRPNCFDNFGWWTSVERDVNNLRERVKFHITKVAFIAKPFETQLLLGIRRDVQQLRRDVAHLTGIVTNGVDPTGSSNLSYLDSITLPDNILTRFTTAFNIKRPACFEEKSDWPLKEAFDALVFHFSKSTIEFNSRPELGQNIPEGPQYVNLLKCTWIMSQLKASSYFEDAGSESLWADYMRGLEDEIIIQFRRFDAKQLIAPPQDVISILPDSYYSIWVNEGPSPRSLDMAEQRPLEEKILELSLPQSYGTRQSSLTVFRKSDTEFRLVTTAKRTDNPLFSYAEGIHVDMTSTRLIPSYATPNENSSVTNNLVLCNDRGQSPEWLSLSDPTGVASVRRALMGYRIHHDMSNFSWCINGSSDEGDWGEGRLQLWQRKPLPVIPPDVGDQSINGKNASASTLRLPQLDLGSNTFLTDLKELGSGQVRTTRPSSEFSDVSAPIAANSPSLASWVSAPSHTVSDKLPWNANSIQTATPPPSKVIHSKGPRSTVNSPSLSNWGSGPSHTLSKENTGRSDLKRHSTGRSSTTLNTRSSIASPVNGPHGEGTELVRPEVPVLVIFTMCKAKYTFLHIKRKQNSSSQPLPLTLIASLINELVEQAIFINPKSCTCKNPRNGCTRAVLESRNKKTPFAVHKFSAQHEQEKGLFSWDLAIFRYPQRQDLMHVNFVEKMKTLDLAFSSVAGERRKSISDDRIAADRDPIQRRTSSSRSWQSSRTSGPWSRTSTIRASRRRSGGRYRDSLKRLFFSMTSELYRGGVQERWHRVKSAFRRFCNTLGQYSAAQKAFPPEP